MYESIMCVMHRRSRLTGFYYSSKYFLAFTHHSSFGDATKVIELTSVVSDTAGSLLAMLKREADNETEQMSMQQLLNTAKSLADALSELVEAAKMVENNLGVGYIYAQV